MTNITITWKQTFHPSMGFMGEETSANFDFDFGTEDHNIILGQMSYASAVQQGNLWATIEQHLPANRTHTSISTFLGPNVEEYGDQVTIDGTQYEAQFIGYKKL